MQKHDFTLVRGDDISYRLLLLWGDNTPLNLAGGRLDLHARTDDSDNPALQLSTTDSTIEVQELGRVVLHFRHPMTQNADWERANYDLQWIDEQGKRTTVMYGKIKLLADQTRL